MIKRKKTKQKKKINDSRKIKPTSKEIGNNQKGKRKEAIERDSKDEKETEKKEDRNMQKKKKKGKYY